MKDEIIAKKKPLTYGDDGIDIFGNTIEALPGKDIKIPIAKNVYEDESGFVAKASISGHVIFVDGKLNVIPILVIEKDVDYSTGNIDFVGSVYIKGNLREGFKIKADGDVIIDGIVEDAIIEAKGDVKVRNGVLGREGGNGNIIANGSLYAKFLQNIKASVGNDIYAKEHIMHSDINAEKNIFVNQGKGKIIGGNLSAEEKVYAIDIGATYVTNTTIKVGMSMKDEKRLEEIKNSIIELSKERDKIESKIASLQVETSEENAKSNKKEIKLQIKKNKEVLKNIQEFLDEKTKIENKIDRENKGSIIAEGKIFGGVNLKIGNYFYDVKKDEKNICFYYNNESKMISSKSLNEEKIKTDNEESKMDGEIANLIQ